MIGYDFVGPRVEVEGVYRNSQATVGGGQFNAFGASKDDIGVMANILYDFNAGGVIVPYIGAGAGVAFDVKNLGAELLDQLHAVLPTRRSSVSASTNIDPQFRVSTSTRALPTARPTSRTLPAAPTATTTSARC